MRGYVYLDMDGNLVRKDKTYIDEMNPLFFSENSHMIIRKWEFDTDNKGVMNSMLHMFKDLRVDSSKVMLFLKDIGFNIASLKENANKV